MHEPTLVFLVPDQRVKRPRMEIEPIQTNGKHCTCVIYRLHYNPDCINTAQLLDGYHDHGEEHFHQIIAPNSIHKCCTISSTPRKSLVLSISRENFFQISHLTICNLNSPMRINPSPSNTTPREQTTSNPGV